MPNGFDHEVKVHLIRHAESTSNAHGNIIGGVGAELTDKGHGQVAVLNAFLLAHPLGVQKAYCSSLVRAKLTCMGLAKGLEVDPATVTYDARLREIDRGDWEMQPRDVIYNDERLLELSHLDMDHRAPNGECMHDVGTRMRNWLYDAMRQAKQDNHKAIAAVTHGIAIKCLLHRLFEIRSSATWEIVVHNTSITTVHLRPGHDWSLVRINAVPHLPPKW